MNNDDKKQANKKLVDDVDSSKAVEHVIDVFQIAPETECKNGVFLVTQGEDGEERYPNTVYAKDINEVIFDRMSSHTPGKYEYKINVYKMNIDYLQGVSVNIKDVHLWASINFRESIPVIVTAKNIEIEEKEKDVIRKTHVRIDILRPDPANPCLKGISMSGIYTETRC